MVEHTAKCLYLIKIQYEIFDTGVKVRKGEGQENMLPSNNCFKKQTEVDIR